MTWFHRAPAARRPDNAERLRQLAREELDLAGLRPGSRAPRRKLLAVLCRATRRLLHEQTH